MTEYERGYHAGYMYGRRDATNGLPYDTRLPHERVSSPFGHLTREQLAERLVSLIGDHDALCAVLAREGPSPLLGSSLDSIRKEMAQVRAELERQDVEEA